MQLSTVEEHVQLLERAKALLARERPGAALGEQLDQREPSETPRRRVAAVVDLREPAEAPRQPVSADARRSSQAPRPRSRYIPAAERREVYRRDCGRCGYVDAFGERCCETRYLEMHHLQLFARQGARVASNLALRRRVRNQLAAEQDFGPELMAKKRDSLRHEALAAQVNANTRDVKAAAEGR